jgi:hypothetical protein
VLSGAVTSVFGGVTLLWDIYQLKGGVQELAAGQLKEKQRGVQKKSSSFNMRLVYEPPLDRCVKGSVHRSAGIRLFLGLPDPFLRDTDPAPYPSIIKQK